MTLTGHWNRIDQRVSKLWPRSVLEQEKQRWDERLKLYFAKVDAHIQRGGSINRSHDCAFQFIARQSLTEIQEKMNTIDVLEGKTPILN
jgi:hypothetical protein